MFFILQTLVIKLSKKMRSDSESQDSDEGRRFRFATTRKDRESKSKKIIQKDNELNLKKNCTSFLECKKSTEGRSSRHKRSNSKETKFKRLSAVESCSHDSKIVKKYKTSRHKSQSKEKLKKQSNDKNEENCSKKKTINSGKMKVKIEDMLSNKYNSASDAVLLHINYKSFFEKVVDKYKINDNFYGPALPPKLEKTMMNARKATNQLDFDDHQIIVPQFKNNLQYDKVENNKNKHKNNNENFEVFDAKKINKTRELTKEEKPLTPCLKNEVIGPVLPDKFINHKIANTDTKIESEDDMDNFVGPFPSDHRVNHNNYIQLQHKLEHRAKKIKEKFGEKTVPKKNKREEWMTELPPLHAVALGIGSISRKLKSTEGPDMSDRSLWTDTPADQLRKKKERDNYWCVPSEDISKKSLIKDNSMENKKGESLLDMHMKTLKKKKKKLKKELEISKRIPFTRDEDLQTRCFDETQKKKIFEKASRLNDRFTLGKF